MELVLSPERLGDNDKGAPFQNEEVREWSHVDRLTGMLERARIETGRWQARNEEGSAHTYGKVIDSRERNSADGSVVQKARRQVEVFQSQGAGGRSFQVVRTSQWSSSRVTDSTSSSPVPASVTEAHPKNEGDNGTEKKTDFKRLNDDSNANRLSQVSRLCRQIHAKTLGNRSSPLLSKPSSPSLTNGYSKKYDSRNGRQSPGLLNGKKSTSNEDITTLNESDPLASPSELIRDCKIRRSLQIRNSNASAAQKNITNRKSLQEVCVKLADLDDESKASSHGGVYATRVTRDRSSTVHSLSDGSEERGGPRHQLNTTKPSNKLVRSYVLGMEDTSKQEIANGASDVGDSTSYRSAVQAFNDNGYRRPTSISTGTITTMHSSSANRANSTVVHLSNNSPTASPQTQTKSSIVTLSTSGPEKSVLTTGIVQCRIHSLGNGFPAKNSALNGTEKYNENRALDDRPSMVGAREPLQLHRQRYDPSDDHESRNDVATDVQNYSDRNSQPGDESTAPTDRPVKKVGFCKTEVHFAADSGKVNIVETDGKPPPSNKFRRRRRNSLLGGVSNNKNLPLIRFGDTSYEKYIFRSGNAYRGDKPVNLADVERSAKSGNLNDQQERKGGWGVKLKSILEPDYKGATNGIEIAPSKSHDGTEEVFANQKLRGHTTTVNLGANFLSKMKHIDEGKCKAISPGIQLRFDARPKSLRSVSTSSDRVSIENGPTKVAVRAPSTMCKISHPLIQSQLQSSVLKSAHLVLSVRPASDANSKIKINGRNSYDLAASDSLSLKNLFFSLPMCTDMALRGDGFDGVDVSRDNYSKKSATVTTTLISTKEERERASPSLMSGKSETGRIVSTLVANEDASNNTLLRSRALLGSSHSARFTSLQSRIPNRFGCATCSRSVNEQQQLQYSSGSEQADEEVRSYMLGSESRREEVQRQKFKSLTMAAREWSASPPALILSDCTSTVLTKNKEDNAICLDETGLNNVDELVITKISDTIHTPKKELESKPKKDKLATEANHEEGSPASADEPENVVSSGAEKNRVVLNVVTTHESTIAHVGCDRSSAFDKSRGANSISASGARDERTKSSLRGHRRIIAKSRPVNSVNGTSHEAKDPCDNSIGAPRNRDGKSIDSDDGSGAVDPPLYVNVFKNAEDEIPIYENYQVTNAVIDKKERSARMCDADVSLAELKRVTDESLKVASEQSNVDTNHSSTECGDHDDDDDDERPKRSHRTAKQKLDTISETKTNDAKQSGERHKSKQHGRTRVKRPVDPTSSTSSIESVSRGLTGDAVKRSETGRSNEKITRTSRSRVVSTNHDRSTMDRKVRSERNSKETREMSKHRSKTQHPSHASDSPPKVVSDNKKLSRSTRSKRPIEIVYETAVYNMKNEKLSKPSRGKESKAPRYINDLICGSKSKRPVDLKRVKGTSMSQQHAHNKSASPTHRHWK